MDKIFIFGAGNLTRNKLQRVPNTFFRNVLLREVQGLIDNDTQKTNTTLLGISIFSPNILYTCDWNYVVVSSSYFQEIKEQLLTELQIPEDKIIDIDKYLRDRFIQYQYDKYMSQNKKSNYYYEKKFNCKSVVVYTAIRDGYDKLKEPKVINNNFKYICFTNNNINSEVWEVINPKEYIDTEIETYWDKKLKIMPHKFFPEYDTSIWVDGSMQIIGEISEYMTMYQKYSDILMMPHYERECVYEEAAACIMQGKGQKKDIINQISYYCSESYPYDNGLVCGGFMVRNHNIGYVKKVMEDWWKQICIFSTRDQISLPYVLWKNQCVVDVSKEYCNDNDWIKVYAHK